MIENTLLKPLTVTALNQRVKRWLEKDIGTVSVTGEVSNLSRPSSGHAYFSLKDQAAQIRCVFFKGRHRKDTNRILQNGQALILQGTLSIYEARGDYQLIVDTIEPKGEGDLFQQFEALKKKLKALGLFDASRKKSFPKYPTAIGLITSPTGAAIRDMETTLKRRFPMAEVILYPTEVQGERAAGQIIQAIEHANLEAKTDVLLLARGGGSLEDLWAFNNEHLAYAIAESHLPIVSGIGHETDFTIADFVADLRAATPTAAAETITPDQHELSAHCERLNIRLHAAIKRLLTHQTERMMHLAKRLKSPEAILQSHWQTLDYLSRHLNMHIKQHLLQKEHDLKQLGQTLNALSPLNTLSRGYAVARTKKGLVKTLKDAPVGSEIYLTLQKGTLTCEVTDHES